jgi:hypothetical protein
MRINKKNRVALSAIGVVAVLFAVMILVDVGGNPTGENPRAPHTTPGLNKRPVRPARTDNALNPQKAAGYKLPPGAFGRFSGYQSAYSLLGSEVPQTLWTMAIKDGWIDLLNSEPGGPADIYYGSYELIDSATIECNLKVQSGATISEYTPTMRLHRSMKWGVYWVIEGTAGAPDVTLTRKE